MISPLVIETKAKIAVVIPCFKVKRHILHVIEQIDSKYQTIYIVDDCCPEGTGKYVLEYNTDSRVVVLFHRRNQGVGGATLTGMRRACEDGAQVVLKIDGDGQMNPYLIDYFVLPILSGQADYTKGNRFYNLEGLKSMPAIRIFGNAALSFFSKFSSGYWDIFDPTNGFIAIHAILLQELDIDKINRRYFFESDMLFRLYTIRAVVLDIPMHSVYGDEISNLKIQKIFGTFLICHIINTFKRIFYTYFLRNFSIASIYLVTGGLLLLFGSIFGASRWYSLSLQGIQASAGTVMLASLPIIIGFQMIVSFLAFDIANVPKIPIHKRLAVLKLSYCNKLKIKP